MENFAQIIGETIPYGPIEMAGVKAVVDSNTSKNFDWGKFGLILLVVGVSAGLLYYVFKPEKTKTSPKENNQPPVPSA